MAKTLSYDADEGATPAVAGAVVRRTLPLSQQPQRNSAGGSSGMAADPFYAVRDALQVEVDALRVRFEAWRAALGTVNTASDTSFQRMHQGACPRAQ